MSNFKNVVLEEEKNNNNSNGFGNVFNIKTVKDS